MALPLMTCHSFISIFNKQRSFKLENHMHFDKAIRANNPYE
jgi:hypothetical protein